MLTRQLERYTQDLLRQGLHRQRQVNDVNSDVIHFSSNDYLSLTRDVEIKKAYQLGFQRYPSGSGGSMLVCGYHSMHQALERAFAEALGVDDCLLFSSGFTANLSVMGLLARFNTHLLIDKQVHASIYDGLLLSNARYSRYLHNNLNDLALKIERIHEPTVLVTESLFSMSGQYAPLVEMASWGTNRVQGMVVDEAHAFGVVGAEGLGGVARAELKPAQVPLRIIPLGKAFAGSGAVVAGQGAWIEALLQSARPYIYSTALSPACAYGLLETLSIVRKADEQRAKLHELVRYFRQAVAASPLKWTDSCSPIQQLQLGCSTLALAVAERLRQQSIVCVAMRQPTVSLQETGLRVILNAHHEPSHIDYLFECLHR